MKNITVAMLENRVVYGERLAAFISRQEESPFNVRLYLEHPAPPEQWIKADIILMTSSLKEIYEKYLDKIQLFVLDEEGNGYDGSSQSVYKYQSAALIYKALIEFCMDRSGKRLMGNGKSGKEWMIIGIYTPVGGEQITSAILSLCRRVAEERKVLYLNLEQVPVFQALLGENERREGISELIYYVKQRSRNLGARLGMMAIKGDFDYLTPAATPFEIGELNEEEWQFCLDRIRSETDYERVIMDFGASVPPGILLDMCSRWLVIRKKKPWEQQLVGQFRQILNCLTDREFEGKIEEIEPEEVGGTYRI